MAIHIKDLVDKFLAKKKEEFKDQEKIHQIISKFMNPAAREGIYFKGIFKKEVVFKSTSSSFRYDFGLKKDKILAGIKEVFPQIKNIRVEIE